MGRAKGGSLNGSISIVPFRCIVFDGDGMATFSVPEKAFEELSKDPERYCAVLINTKMNVHLAHELFKAKKVNSHLKVLLAAGVKESDGDLLGMVDKVIPAGTKKEHVFEIIAELYGSTESSRKRLLLEKLEFLGAQQEAFKNFSASQLEGIVTSLTNLLSRHTAKTGGIKLSTVDKKVLKSLITSKGHVSSLLLSKKLGIPLTTVQRHRKRLEKEFLEYSYNLKVAKFGLRNADILIHIKSGTMEKVAERLLELDRVVSVSRAIGTSNIDLRARIIFQDNLELSKFIEKVRAIDGVGEVMWMESIQQMGSNDLPFLRILED
ncbi:Lrp/AsnC family transcriptional regulator [Nitrososphaera sp.]|uniref:Lrp/AsnC family transcriptional regulator n=1 Tax=Nitrososphaera sp. TaxID=1971748 RepID=UPI0031754763